MLKTCWTVRVINHLGDPSFRDYLPIVWVEQLRYMGHVRILDENEARQVLEFIPPLSQVRVDGGQMWARHNADRMASFGFNAVVAPEWKSGEPD